MGKKWDNGPWKYWHPQNRFLLSFSHCLKTSRTRLSHMLSIPHQLMLVNASKDKLPWNHNSWVIWSLPAEFGLDILLPVLNVWSMDNTSSLYCTVSRLITCEMRHKPQHMRKLPKNFYYTTVCKYIQKNSIPHFRAFGFPVLLLLLIIQS